MRNQLIITYMVISLDIVTINGTNSTSSENCDSLSRVVWDQPRKEAPILGRAPCLVTLRRETTNDFA